MYLPPGTYRITRTLSVRGPKVGVLIVGHGRDTVLAWDGEAGGTLLQVDGIAYSRYVGLSFESGGKAAVGLLHRNDSRFVTQLDHEHLAFRHFADAAILHEPASKQALAETTFENCLFEDCRRGVAFLAFNDYDFTFDGCEFHRQEIAIDNYCGQISLGHQAYSMEPAAVKIQQRGDCPVRVLLMGSCFYGVGLDVQQEAGLDLVLAGNIAVGKTPAPAAVADRLPADAISRIAAAFDDLRRLGAADERLNHAGSR